MTADDAAQVLVMLADLRRRMPEQSTDAQLIEACEAGARSLRMRCATCRWFVQDWADQPICDSVDSFAKRMPVTPEFGCAQWDAKP